MKIFQVVTALTVSFCHAEVKVSDLVFVKDQRSGRPHLGIVTVLRQENVIVSTETGDVGATKDSLKPAKFPTDVYKKFKEIQAKHADANLFADWPKENFNAHFFQNCKALFAQFGIADDDLMNPDNFATLGMFMAFRYFPKDGPGGFDRTQFLADLRIDSSSAAEMDLDQELEKLEKDVADLKNEVNDLSNLKEEQEEALRQKYVEIRADQVELKLAAEQNENLCTEAMKKVQEKLNVKAIYDQVMKEVTEIAKIKHDREKDVAEKDHELAVANGKKLDQETVNLEKKRGLDAQKQLRILQWVATIMMLCIFVYVIIHTIKGISDGIHDIMYPQ